MRWLQWPIVIVSIILHVFVLASLRRNGYRQYPFVFVYCIVFLVTILGEACVFSGVISLSRASKSAYFYGNNALREFLLFGVVVSLIEHALQGTTNLFKVRIFVGAAASFAVFLSLSIHSDAATTYLWMTEVTRDLSFGSVVLTLLLWSMLIASRKK